MDFEMGGAFKALQWVLRPKTTIFQKLLVFGS